MPMRFFEALAKLHRLLKTFRASTYIFMTHHNRLNKALPYYNS